MKGGGKFQSPSLRGSGRFYGVHGIQDHWRTLVSIPFIAGQWSLPDRSRRLEQQLEVSIPFIAGQWSLRKGRSRGEEGGDVSIPFIAGQWSLPRRSASRRARASGFNPLHCGAVVASEERCEAYRRVDEFQSPSLRGSGRFWFTSRFSRSCFSRFNPLHCGAVVASDDAATEALLAALGFQSPSLRGSGRFASSTLAEGGQRPSRFNPLHCGAVVASVWRAWAEAGARAVSIPFIAGQWSLHPEIPDPVGVEFEVSIPFIAGQWSLLASANAASARFFSTFQSPSLRGSGRFLRSPPASAPTPAPVSIPFIAGQWSLLGMSVLLRARSHVSIPFIAGQWSLLSKAARLEVRDEVSIPFIAGQWSLRPPKADGGPNDARVSIPFIAGQWSLL